MQHCSMYIRSLSVQTALIFLWARPSGACAHEGCILELDSVSLLQTSLQFTRFRSNWTFLSESAVYKYEASQPSAARRHQSSKLEAGSLGTDRLGQESTIWCSIACVCVMIVVGCMFKEPEHVGRSSLLDNAKAFAMCLVLFQHTVDVYEIFHHVDKTAQSTDPFKSLRLMVSAVNMSLFSLISGLCSQEPPTAKRIRGLIISILIPAVIQVIFVQPVLFQLVRQPSQWHEVVLGFVRLETLPNVWHIDYWPWYVFAILVWRMLAFMFSEFFSSLPLTTFVFISSVAMSCIGGYHDFGSPINQTIGYFPYFAIGYVLPFKEIMNRVFVLPSGTRCFVATCVVVMLIASPFLNLYLPDPHYSYPEHLQDLEHYLWVLRLTRITLDAVICLPLLLFVLPRGENFLTSRGRYTLYPYLYTNHMFAIIPKSLSYFILLDKLEKSTAIPVKEPSLVSGLLIVAPIHAAMSLLYFLFFTSRLWRRLFSWHVEPTWANPLMNWILPDSYLPEVPSQKADDPNRCT
mmetsp:Transcript_16623/g.30200  ORF Transcript_16623/g.30200 Transcript_16623/m.30200 type:complete len:518 (+) Transcript_16623:74-1627(+)